MLEGELTAYLGYEKYEAKGRNSGNSRNGRYKRSVRSSDGGKSEIAVPRDRNGEFEPKMLHKDETSSNELEDKIVMLYAKGVTTGDIRDSLGEMYGVKRLSESGYHLAAQRVTHNAEYAHDSGGLSAQRSWPMSRP